jgi:hypothetical protein
MAGGRRAQLERVATAPAAPAATEDVLLLPHPQEKPFHSSGNSKVLLGLRLPSHEHLQPNEGRSGGPIRTDGRGDPRPTEAVSLRPVGPTELGRKVRGGSWDEGFTQGSGGSGVGAGQRGTPRCRRRPRGLSRFTTAFTAGGAPRRHPRSASGPRFHLGRSVPHAVRSRAGRGPAGTDRQPVTPDVGSVTRRRPWSKGRIATDAHSRLPLPERCTVKE